MHRRRTGAWDVHRSPRSAPGLPILFLATLVLLVCSFYVYQRSLQPYPGFQLDPATWRVTAGNRDCFGAAACPRTGDLVLSLGDLTREAYESSWARVLPWEPDVPVVVRRELGDGEVVELEFLWKAESRPPVVSLVSWLTAVIPLVFWAMGVLATVFVRPRDGRHLLLILLNFDVALWVAAGTLSATHLYGSTFVFHIFIWCFLPLVIHLHLELLGVRSGPAPRRFLMVLYGLTAGMIALDLGRVLPPNAFFWPLALGLLGSMAILFVKAAQRGGDSDHRRRLSVRLMLLGISFGLGPLLLVAGSTALVARGPADPLVDPLVATALFLLTVPIWPLSYGYSIYKHRMGALEVRANRILGTYVFVIVVVLLCALLALGFQHLDGVGEPALFALLPFVVFVAPWLRRKCQRMVDEHVFGLRHRPGDLIGVFAEQLPAATLDPQGLRRVVEEEILPALLIRQAAMWLVSGNDVEVLFEVALDDSAGSATADRGTVDRLLGTQGRYLRESDAVDPALAWVRAALPIRVEGQLAGVWLLGRRDPDDFYSRADLELLERMAHLIGSVLFAQGEMSQRQALQDQLFHAQKMEAVGQLGAGLAHDFNNLLAVIRMNCDLLQHQRAAEPSKEKYLRGILDATQRAEDLTRQLLTFSSQRVAQPRAVALNRLISDLGPLLDAILADGVRLVWRLAPDLPAARVDPAGLEQAVMNLAVNACDAMPGGGTLTLETRAVPAADGSAEVWPAIVVTDTGTGIPREIRNRIFEPFFTTKVSGKGTGLGLSIVYGILEQLGGRVTIDSPPGGGTSFTLKLPPAPAEAAEPPPREELRTAEGSSILLVDDDGLVRKVVEEALAAAGYRVLVAENGASALELFDRRGAELDLLLTDVVMPGLSGVDLASALLDKDPDLRVLYMSGYNNERLLTDEVDRTEVSLLQKPFSEKDLLESVVIAMGGAAGAGLAPRRSGLP
ncbi:MAG: ATP-binding protein [Acidobacteriota bacterium]